MKTFVHFCLFIILIASCDSGQQEKSPPTTKPSKENIMAESVVKWNPGEHMVLITEGGDAITYVRTYQLNNQYVIQKTYCASRDTLKREHIDQLSNYNSLSESQLEHYGSIDADTLSVDGFQAIEYTSANKMDRNFYELFIEGIGESEFYVSIVAFNIDGAEMKILKEAVRTIKLMYK